MFDLRVIHSVLDQLQEERGIPREKMIDAIENALATAYKKEYGKRGQIVRAVFDMNTGATEFNQVKIVVDESMVRFEEDLPEEDPKRDDRDRRNDREEEIVAEDGRVRFDPEKHILIDDARKMKKDVQLGEEIIFPLESKSDFGRIAAQTAKQVIIQKIREAEKVSALDEFGQKEGEIVNGHVQRMERGNIYVDLGRVTGVLPYDEQIPGERYRTGERIRCLLASVEETPRGIFLKLSRSSGKFLERLFALEAPELQSGVVEIKAVAREAGSRSKVAVHSNDDHVDPVGSLVGQRGVRVSTVMSELGGEKIDIIEWSEAAEQFIEDALSPAKVLSVEIVEDETGAKRAQVEVSEDQQSLAIGRGGQNVRLAAKLTGWKIDIRSLGGEETTGAQSRETEKAKEVSGETADTPASEEETGETEKEA